MIDVAIVGGGAAGIAAARTLHAAGRTVRIVEAGPRLGGRAHTAMVAGMPLDLGCGWLHSATRNPWVGIAEAAGIAVDRTPTAWGRQWRDLGFSPAERAEAAAAYDAFDARLRTSVPSDRAVDALAPGGRWNAWLEALSGYINGVELAALSVQDYLAYDDAAIDADWRLPGGYGALVAGAAAGLAVTLDTPVTAIRLDGRGVRLETPRGAIEAAAAIVTVSTEVVARGACRLPPDHDAIAQAAADLPLGLADKLFLGVEGADDLDADSHLIGDPHRATTGSYYLRPFGRPVIECFFGGAGARALERAGPAATAAFAIDQLAALLGSDWRRRLTPIAASAWGRDPLFGGSYSHARPGRRAARAVLATPIDPRLHFAGEACSSTDFSTAHGAFATGVAAARAVLADTPRLDLR
ncbi:MAG: FAD-dependent oxidoreductase [Sphingomonas fennica]